MKYVKKISLKEGIKDAIEKASSLKRSILLSYSFHFGVRDLLPILTHPSDKNNIRIYWEQPSKGFSFAGLGSILNFESQKKLYSQNIYKEINQIMEDSISISNNILIGPKIIGGYAFNQYIGIDKTWQKFPRIKFMLYYLRFSSIFYYSTLYFYSTFYSNAKDLLYNSG